jgi:SAM-dependent methyltransferase
MAMDQAATADARVDGGVWSRYTPTALRLYHVGGKFLLRVVWRCPLTRVLEHYDEHVSARHLDIGVADGYFLHKCRFPVEDPEITLMDPHPNMLAFASERLARYKPRTHQADILEPFGLPPASFDSVGMSFVLHCVPGTMLTKAVAFEHARSVLAPGGVVFGNTVLNEGVPHTPVSRLGMKLFNHRGEFCNYDDHLADLDAALGATFPEHRIDVEGSVALFSARAA